MTATVNVAVRVARGRVILTGDFFDWTWAPEADCLGAECCRSDCSDTESALSRLPDNGNWQRADLFRSLPQGFVDCDCGCILMPPQVRM